MKDSEYCNIIICGPSAVGKTAILKHLGVISPYKRTKSYSTRKSRGPEDKEYNFLSRQDFEQKIRQGYFFEYNEIFGNFYGIARASLDGSRGKINIFNMDVEGAGNLKASCKNTITILVIPPSLKELSDRLRGRDGKLSQERIARQRQELSFLADFYIENQNIEEAAEELLQIIRLQEKNLLLRNKIKGFFR
jgi:guanylate kinase